MIYCSNLVQQFKHDIDQLHRDQCFQAVLSAEDVDFLLLGDEAKTGLFVQHISSTG